MIYRHPPLQIHLDSCQVVDRGGETCLAEALETADGALYVRHPSRDHPRIETLERWLLPSLGCMVHRWTLRPGAKPYGFDWYVDVDRITAAEHCWLVNDRFLDVIVHEGRDYEVIDADEMAEALEAGLMPVEEAVATLRALDGVTAGLRRHGWSVAALLAELAPGLPR